VQEHEEKVEEVEAVIIEPKLKKASKRAPKKPKVTMSSEEIEPRYQEHLKRLRGGK